MEGCQYLGPEFDARKWKYTEAPTPYCGAKTVGGRHYCGDHIWTVYQKGTSINGKRAAKAIDDEIAAVKLAQEIAELENEDE